MSDPSKPTEKRALAEFVAVPTAPVVYFDFVPTHGVLGGALQIELAARALIPLSDGGMEALAVEVARLRCTPTSAKFLKDALESALRMLEQPQSPPMAAAKLN